VAKSAALVPSAFGARTGLDAPAPKVVSAKSIRAKFDLALSVSKPTSVRSISSGERRGPSDVVGALNGRRAWRAGCRGRRPGSRPWNVSPASVTMV
jgi:hypothetical protein